MNSGTQRLDPEDWLEPNPEGLGEPGCDPFLDPEALVEGYLMDAYFDFVRLRLTLLFGIWTALCQLETGNVGLMLCEEVSEFGWKAEGWDIARPPSWWTVLSNEFTSLNNGARVELASTPGWSPIFGTRQPVFRYHLELVPNSELIVQFASAEYFVGTQAVPDNEEFRPSLFAPTEWHYRCHWPR